MHLSTRALAMVLVGLLITGCQDGRGSTPGSHYLVMVEATIVDRLDLFARSDDGTADDGRAGENANGGGSQHGSGFNFGSLGSGGGGDPRGLLLGVAAVLATVAVVELGAGVYNCATGTRGPHLTDYDLVFDGSTRPDATLHVSNGHGLWVPDELVDAVRRGDYSHAMLLPAGQNRIGISVRVGFSGTDMIIRPAPAAVGRP